MINANNRPQVVQAIGGSTSKKHGVLRAAKKLKIKSVVLVTLPAITASGANYATLKLQKSALLAGVPQTPADIAGIAAVDTQAGVAAYGHVALDVAPEIVLEAGETLWLDKAITGTLTVDAWLHIDYEVMAS
jgi:hypothetical protein